MIALVVQDLVVDGDPSSLYYTARGLMRLQQLYGTAGRVTGKGLSAAGVRDLLLRMRREMGSRAPPVGGCSASPHWLVLRRHLFQTTTRGGRVVLAQQFCCRIASIHDSTFRAESSLTA